MTTEEEVDDAAAATVAHLDSMLDRRSEKPIFAYEAVIVRRAAARMQQQVYGGPKPKDPLPHFMLIARSMLHRRISRFDRPRGV